MLYEISMLKHYPQTRMNTDESGQPKTCLFGNTTRSRISSQCQKHAWRTSAVFQDAVGAGNLGVRTRTLPTLVKDKLIELGLDKELAEACVPVLSGFGTKEGKPTKNGDTASLIFCCAEDIDAIAQCTYEAVKDCSKPKEIAKKLNIKDLRAQLGNHRPISLDIALYGRMTTDPAFKDVDASVQVAHAFSTNREATQSDFFTAMDDCLSGDDDIGAGMLGDREFNSSCYYAFISIDSDKLMENLKGIKNAEVLARKTILALIRAIAFVNPSGSQNSFSGQVLPSAMLIECKEQKIPVSMANAYAVPVTGRDLVGESIKRLCSEADMIARNYGLPVKERLWFCVDKFDVKPESATKVCGSFQDLLDAVEATM